MKQKEPKEYFDDKQSVWVDNNYHQMLKILAAKANQPMRFLVHDMIEQAWFKSQKEK